MRTCRPRPLDDGAILSATLVPVGRWGRCSLYFTVFQPRKANYAVLNAELSFIESQVVLHSGLQNARPVSLSLQCLQQM
jgi:hypothetical protein